MRRWADDNGEFIALDDYYDAITFREPSRPGVLDLSHRPVAR
ncbi:MAG: hypothetical protein OXC13_12585 [Caldilineaceae bacterium]|nr:hypothetical protein [Caldilineaceae bacterium]